MASSIPLPHHPQLHGRVDPRLRSAVIACVVALLVHLVPFFLPRKVPSVEVDLARLVPTAEHRLPLLLPLLENPRSTPADLRDAAELVLSASPSTARRFLAEAERRGPASAENELLRARICHVDLDPGCVADALEKARALAPKDPRPELLESDFAEVAGDPRQALAALGRAHDKSPQDVELALRYAHALGASARVPDGEAVLASLSHALAPARLSVERGVLYLNANKVAQARAQFDRALVLDRTSATAHYFRGVALAREGEEPKAEVELREADRIDPSDYRALATLCALQREDGRVDEASVSRGLLDARFGDRRSADYDGACPP